jgi:integrase
MLSVTKDNYKGHTKSPWLVVIPRRLSPTGRRQYRRFATRAAAQNYCAAIKLAVKNNGEKPLATIPADLAADASAAQKLLEGTGLTLTEAARHYLAIAAPNRGACSLPLIAGGAEEEATAVTFRAAVDALMADKPYLATSTKNARASVFSILFKTCPELEHAPLHACTTPILAAAMDKTFTTECSWNNGRRHIHAVFSFAIRRQLVTMQNPVTPLELKRIHEKEITVLHPSALRELFAAARPATPEEIAAAQSLPYSERYFAAADLSDIIPYLAICAFAGIRPKEATRITWADIDWEDNIISVRRSKAKTGGCRHIELHPTLRAWLLAARPANAAPSDTLAPATCATAKIRNLRRRCGYGTDKEWQNDCLRHSYATFYLKAQLGNITQLQLNMGHRSTQLLYSRYVNMAGTTRAMAQEWWSILPPTSSPAPTAGGSQNKRLSSAVHSI